MFSNTFYICGIDDFDDAIRIIDDFSDSEVTLQEEEDDIDPDLDGNLDAYNNMQTLTSTSDEEVSDKVDEDFEENGLQLQTHQELQYMFVEELLVIEDLDAEVGGMSDLEVHTGFVDFFCSNKSNPEHTDNLLKGLDHKKGTQIMLLN